MKIIVIGVGKVGYTVSQELAAEKHDVVMVDKNEAALNGARSALDVMGICGTGTSSATLREAGVETCDLLIALTGSDEVNLLCCLLAKQLGAKGTIARVRTPNFNEEIDLIKDSMGLTMYVNPDREAAREILGILKLSSAMNVESFSRGRVNLLSFQIQSNCSLCGSRVQDFFAKSSSNVLISAVQRDDRVFIPSGDFVIESGDTVAILATAGDAYRFLAEIGLPCNEIDSVMIIGGGRIAYYLAREMSQMKLKVTIIERDRAAAEQLSLDFPKVNVICGDGTSRELLTEEGIMNTDAVCCLTGIDEENILLSLFAKSTSSKIKTITKVNRVSFDKVIKRLDVGSVIYPKNSTANIILQHVRAKQNSIGSGVDTLYRIIDNKVEALEFHVGEGCSLIGKPLRDLRLKDDILVGCISRGGQAFIPHGPDALELGDSVIIVTTVTGLSDLDDIIDDSRE